MEEQKFHDPLSLDKGESQPVTSNFEKICSALENVAKWFESLAKGDSENFGTPSKDFQETLDEAKD